MTLSPLRMALAAACLLPLGAHAADQGATLRSQVDAVIKPLMAEHGVPGMAVAVTAGGKAYVFNYGVAAKDKHLPVTDATLFELGSVSKTMTATLASYAQVTGKLSLDDHPGKYMPQLKGTPIDKATMLHLGTYTAGGLPLQFPDAVADDQMLSYFQQWTPDAAPGVQRRYSNPSLGLFGHVSALALKGGFTHLMETQVFPQLGLKNTHIRVPDAAMANFAWGHNQKDKPVRMNPDIFSPEAYGVVSSAADVLKFVQANIAPDTVADPMGRAVKGTQVGYFRVRGMVQGLGWEQFPYPVALADLEAVASSAMREASPAEPIASPTAPSKGTLFIKTGSTAGFSTVAGFVPDRKIGVVILGNKVTPGPARVQSLHAIMAHLERMGQ